ncbi:hypothetical protein EW146_g4730 [Bondarzewia mesenterica]|uniref:Uncharacterized protein n=1 Tax=Bondarzewia mesenterica TaxID=1095465 RepID=A0A4S4LU49_9AGAM|nr:hypothetical protein EW146_g4730 [Bondarzewia mesenterica]
MRDDDIIPEHLSHHYLLSSSLSSLPLQPIDTSYYATPLVSPPPTSPLDSDQSLLNLLPQLHYTPLPSDFRSQQPFITTQVIIRSTMAPSMPARDAAKTYEDFKSAIYKLYPRAEEDKKWSIADMDKLIGEHSRIGILSIGDLGEYHCQFLNITTFLIAKKRLSVPEQSRTFAQGFHPKLWARVSQCLQLKSPDHFPDNLYDIQEVHDAAQFVLHGTTSAVQPTNISSLPSIAPIASATEVKMEDLVTMFEHITETFVKALSGQQAVAPPRPLPNPETAGRCTFCGNAGHYMRNPKGKVILSSGAFIPRSILGLWLKERIDEWHHRNPGQIARGQLLHNVLPNVYYDRSAPAPADPPAPVIAMTAHLLAYHLTTDDRIASLERKLFQLHNQRHPRTMIMRRPEANSDEESSDNTPKVPHHAALKVSRPVPYVQVPPRPKLAPADPTRNVDPPIHPYAAARDATYVPPVDKVTNEVPQPPAIKKQEPAYRTMAPIYDEAVTKDVYDRAMSSSITVTQHELLSLSLEVRAQIRKAMAGQRIPQHDDGQAKILMQDNALPFALDDLDPPCNIENTAADIMTASFVQILHQPLVPPEGSLVIPDPYEAYFNLLTLDEEPEPLIVAKESSALHSILPLINHQQQVESIVDPGSQIIAMSEEVCNELALIYDPNIVLNMQSANGKIDKSLSLACNVPFLIGDIALYLQVHVIHKSAYDILLGHPFDVLTESIIKNFANENQTITIHDLNTGCNVTMPTLARGPPPFCLLDPSTSPLFNIQLSYLSACNPAIFSRSDPSAFDSSLLSAFTLNLTSQVPIQSLLSTLHNDLVSIFTAKCKYKPVAQKVRPILAELPDKFRIIHNISGNLLVDMPYLSPTPPPFHPFGRYTSEYRDIINNFHPGDFLWPAERDLMHHFMCVQNEGFTWNDTECSHFREDFFPPVDMPVVAHKPWVLHNMPIPPGIYDKVCDVICTKIAAGDGSSLRLVHSLEPLNAVTIQHSGIPPYTDQITEQFASCTCGGMLDLYVRYDERTLAESSHDYTTFQTPYGPLHLVTLPMGWTNSVPIFHNDITFILQPEILDTTIPYIDDVPVRGPATQYLLPDRSPETHPDNSRICRFV